MTNQAITVAPPLDAFREQAERAIDMHFVQVSPRLVPASEDAATIAAAMRVRDGGTPPAAFASEADMRGMSVADLASRVLVMSEEMLERKLRRVAVKQAVRAAQTHAEIAAALSAAGIPLPRNL